MKFPIVNINVNRLRDEFIQAFGPPTTWRFRVENDEIEIIFDNETSANLDQAITIINAHDFVAAQTSDAATAVRAERDRRIDAIMWRYERLGRQFRLNLPMTDDMATLDAYVQALADLPAQPGFPNSINWPVEP